MRRLMVLGGLKYSIPVIEAAHKLGCYVITCDNVPENIAHKYSDEYCNVSIVNMDDVLNAAKRLKIDGIISFACDPGVITAAYVAEKMNLPSVGSYESVCILQNKSRFRKFLKENGFNVPNAKGYTSVEEALNDTDFYNWPVVVKPTDSAGSKGVTKVDNPLRLKQSIEYALSFSRSNEFIIEDYLEPIGFSSDTDSFSVNGELKFISFNCQLFDENAENPHTPAAYSWPASISEAHQLELQTEIQRLITLLELDTSIYNIETRECVDGKAYIMECSPRGGGNRLAEMLKYATGVDLITNAVRAAIGEPCLGVEQMPYDGFWAEIILHSDKSGAFNKMWISDAIRDNVIEEDLWIEPGTHIGAFSAANEAVGTLVLKFGNEKELQRVLDNPNEYFKVYVS